jgi:formylglycine-generating enzyme
MFRSTVLSNLLAVVLLSGAVSARADVFHMSSGLTSLQFVPVGDTNNAADANGRGAVTREYQMGKCDVTVAQYCQFLNSVATAADPYGLYDSGMRTDMPTVAIVRSGTAGYYHYDVTGGLSGTHPRGGDLPIFDVSWADAARFCNWLRLGQPVGAEGTATTETGAYNLNGATTVAALMTVTRNLDAVFFLPTEDQWYKAAYYKGGSTAAGYWAYPNRSNETPINVLSSTATNNANFDDHFGTGTGGYTDSANRLTAVGAFAASVGPYGTYDMGGNVWQWCETPGSGSTRDMRGGSWRYSSISVGTTIVQASSPLYNYKDIGFRVATIPEPGSFIFLACAAIFALTFWRRR